MHQFASSIMTFFLSPFNWIIILIIAQYLIHKGIIKKICTIFALCIFLVFGNTWLLDWYAKNWQPSPVAIQPGIVYSCGIIPGGFASPDADENGYFNSASDRFIQAVKLYKLGKIKHILISGGNGKINKKNFREAVWVKSEFITMGIPDSVLLTEDKSNNTAGNAKYAKLIIDSRQLQPPYLLITSAHHEPRALLLFKQAGMAVVPFPCNYIAGRGGKFTFASLIPKPSTLLGWNSYLKETTGYYWYSFRKYKN